MKVAYFTHSLHSCWNHGNAHFVRGVLRDLAARGHSVTAYEPADAWSRQNLLSDCGESGLEIFAEAYPDLHSVIYSDGAAVVAEAADANLVVVHEWNEPELVAALGRKRAGGADYTLLFHDTHHRAVSDPDAIRRFDLDGYDGVLAFGETLAAVYRRWGWGDRVHVWHEAADTTLFHPPTREAERHGLVWIGNWGDDERTDELDAFLLGPAETVGLPLDIFGVRYPEHALATLTRRGARYHGWAPNPSAPRIFARHLATVHVPRRFYVEHLPGIPTIRVFEALACGIPLASAPWQDTEGLFRPGEDFLLARDRAEMERHLLALRNDPDLRASLAASGLETIRARHTCRHRVDELLAVTARLREPAPPLRLTA